MAHGHDDTGSGAVVSAVVTDMRSGQDVDYEAQRAASGDECGGASSGCACMAVTLRGDVIRSRGIEEYETA